MISRSIIYSAPGEVYLENQNLEGQGPFLQSLLMGISAGTEKLLLSGHAPESSVDPDMDCGAQSFEYPFQYGYINICQSSEGRRFFAFYPHQTVFPAAKARCIPIPRDISDEDAIFLANMETALSMVHDLAPIAGERIVVMGAGVVGLLSALILSQSLPGGLLLVDKNPAKEEYARLYGLDFLLAEGEDWVNELKESWGFLDAGINTSASAQGLEALMELSTREGRIIEGSWYGKNPVPLKLGENFHRKRLQLISSQVSRIPERMSSRWTKERRFSFCWDLIRRFRPSRLISHRFLLDNYQEAYQTLLEEPDHMQIIMRP